ncbi:MAG: TonB-dependent receptor plug domain-containing protein [Gemmatimonadetes bacterium]|nr:TonB-dependent receptor plug domain-containing protein [Gemmatimonadota bacterium]
MQRHLSAILLLGLCLLVFRADLAFGESSPRLGAVRGKLQEENGDPIAYADVFVVGTGRGAITEPDGSFEITDLPVGKQTLRFNRIGYESDTLRIHVVADSSLPDVVFTLLPFDQKASTRIRIGATNRMARKGPFSSSRVGGWTIRERAAKTPAEALREEPGVFVQKTNHGGGSAIMRGFGSNQILLMVDGIRLNNSTFRLGNHQYLTTIDPFSLHSIEVYRGPNSVAYGTDALGGVIDVKTWETRQEPNTKGFHAATQGALRYATTDGEKSAHLRGLFLDPNWTGTIGLSARRFGDLKRGANSNDRALENATNGTEQLPTAFDAWDIDAKLRWIAAPRDHVTFAYQRGKQIEVPRYDKYENEGFDRWVFDPQVRELAYARYLRGRWNGDPLFQLTLSRNLQEEGRETRPDPAEELTVERDRVTTWGANAEGYWTPNRANRVVFGGDFYTDDVESARERHAPDGGITRDAQGRFPDGAGYRSGGVFVLEQFRPMTGRGGGRVELDAGVRYSWFDAEFTPGDSALVPEGSETVSQTFDALTGSLGGAYRLGDPGRFRVYGNVSQAFRAPNLSDITKLGESKGTTYEVPNYGLDAEKLVSYELGISSEDRYGNWRTDWQLAGFYSQVDNLLGSADTTFAGEPFIIEGGDTLAIKTKKNIGEGFIRGAEISLRTMRKPWLVQANATITHGENTTLDEPIGGIPPAFGLVSVRRYGSAKGDIRLYARWALEQDRLSDDDLDDPRIPVGGTPGWITWNLAWSIGLYRLPGHPILNVNIENILDTNYREHGSGVNGPGRNLVLSLRWRTGSAVNNSLGF